MLGEFFNHLFCKKNYLKKLFFIQIQVGRWAEDSGLRRREKKDILIKDVQDDRVEGKGDGR